MEFGFFFFLSKIYAIYCESPFPLTCPVALSLLSLLLFCLASALRFSFAFAFKSGAFDGGDSGSCLLRGSFKGLRSLS